MVKILLSFVHVVVKKNIFMKKVGYTKKGFHRNILQHCEEEPRVRQMVAEKGHRGKKSKIIELLREKKRPFTNCIHLFFHHL